MLEQNITGNSVERRKAYTVVNLAVMMDGTLYQGMGVSKCNPVDEFNAERGAQIARGRATLDIAEQMMVGKG